MEFINTIGNCLSTDLHAKNNRQAVQARIALTHTLLQDGHSGKAIAALLQVTEATVSYYKQRLDGEIRYNNFNRLLRQVQIAYEEFVAAEQ